MTLSGLANQAFLIERVEMGYLLDTCALSEMVARKKNHSAFDAIKQLPREQLFLSVIVIGEIQSGIDQMVECPRKDFLLNWLEKEIIPGYDGRTFPIDAEISRVWGSLNARLIRQGLKMQAKDSLIAATALVHGLTIVTRNEHDFVASGAAILNPWK
jgi:predicted nucleic acid-binding protein